MNKIDSITLSKYILDKIPNVNHLKLQKLLYYIEAWHLVMFNESIIEDDFEAWIHGPASKKIWDYFKGYSILYKGIEISEKDKKEALSIVENTLSQSQKELINDVLTEYGDKTEYYLEGLTHYELPWRNARKGCQKNEKCNNIISKREMKTYYENLLEPDNEE